MHFGRRLYQVLGPGLVVFLFGTLGRLPPVVASHFDGSGVPNGWSSRAGYAVIMLFVGLVLPLAVVGLVHRVTRDGPGRLNLPARDYWSRPEHAGEAVRRVRAYLWWLACIMTGVVAAIHTLILAAHTHDPPRLDQAGIILLLGGAIAALAGWTAGWYRLLRPPLPHG
jgi:Protein of unknown function (DUF1648)